MDNEKLTPGEILDRYRYKGKLTPKLRKSACELVEKGTPPKTAVVALGVGESTYRLWRSNAETEGSDPKYKEFFEELQKAEQQCLSEVACNASQATKRDGKVALDFLGRRDPDQWGRKETLVIETEIGPRIAAITSGLADRIAEEDAIEGGSGLAIDNNQKTEGAESEPPLLLGQ